MSTEWVLKGKALCDKLDKNLAPYAIKNKYALEDNVRLYEQDFPQNDSRTPFQHDRDRIIHSRAFRRLRGKTQVFISAKGDHFRTRLSHTLEVSQISRSIARVFSLNEDLVEAIALGHDLGHTPFGHIGERTLNNILRGKTNIVDLKRDLGGFKHNYNSLKMVDSFEKTYDKFRGLNLTKWTREGIWKHTDLFYKDEPSVYDSILNLSSLHPEIGYCTFLEGQVVAIADEIAQVTHDLEDAFRARIISVENKDLERIPLFKDAIEMTNSSSSSIFRELRSGLIRYLIKVLIDDVIQNTEKLIEDLSFDPTVEPLGYLVFDFSSETKKQYEELKNVVYDYINHSFEVSRMDIKGKLYIEELFKAYYEDPKRLQDYAYERYSPGIGRKDLTDARIKSLRLDPKFIRVIADEIAGMTDMFAIDEYRRLYLPDITSITIV